MDHWGHMSHWHLVLPPSRPSAKQLHHIRARLADVPRAMPVAVLGSTPEFRDLLYECGFERIFILDRNADFSAAVSKNRIYANAETFVHGDWRASLAQFRSTFAVVLSDLTSGNIPYEHRAEFYDLISDALTIGGRFFDKVLTHEDNFLEVEALIMKYADLPLNLVHVNYFSSEMLFCSEFLRDDHTVNSNRFYARLDALVKHERVRAFVRNAQLITPLDCNWWYGRSWSELSASYCPRLTLVAEMGDELGSPYLGFLRFFEFERGHRRDLF